MKKLYFSIFILTLLSCSNNSISNNCFSNFTFSAVINLNNAEFIDIQVPGTHVETIIQNRNILIIRRTTNEYKAFDLECPERGCNSPMTFDGLRLKCSCDNLEYDTLSGAPVNSDGCFALEYVVTNNGNGSLLISF